MNRYGNKINILKRYNITNRASLHSSVGKRVCLLRSLLQSERHRFEPDTKPLIFLTLLFMFSLNNNYKPNHLKSLNDVQLVFFYCYFSYLFATKIKIL